MTYYIIFVDMLLNHYVLDNETRLYLMFQIFKFHLIQLQNYHVAYHLHMLLFF